MTITKSVMLTVFALVTA